VVEHPPGEDAVELPVAEGEALDVGDLRVDAARTRELDHARRDVDRLHLGPGPHEPLRQLAGPAADVEDTRRRRLDHRLDGRVVGMRALHERSEDRVALVQTLLARELPADEERVVEPHGVTIG